MWKTICTNDGVYLFQYEQEENTFVVHLTDLKNIWLGKIQEDKLIKKFQVTMKTVSNIKHNLNLQI